MISYAQNLEDVVLSRLTKFVPHGRYVDVGAGHPILENVTYWLYTQGWRGINIEPMVREAEMLRQLRPEDVTMQIAVGSHAGTLRLFEAPIENRGATTSHHATVEKYRASGQDFVPFEVEMSTLDVVLDSHPMDDLHLLKVDVEGFEQEVLDGVDLSRHRPWVVVMEATEPNSTVPSHSAWEHRLVAGGYRCVLFDGLNRFYVRDDLDHVGAALSVPANYFDSWTSHHEQILREELAAAGEYAASLGEHLKHAEEYARSLEDRVRDTPPTDIGSKRTILKKVIGRTLHESDRPQP